MSVRAGKKICDTYRVLNGQVVGPDAYILLVELRLNARIEHEEKDHEAKHGRGRV